MATATKTPTPTLAERIVSNVNEVAIAAEDLLFDADSYAQFSAAERSLLKAAGFATRDDIDRQLGRIRSVKAHMQMAGSAAELQAAEKNTLDAERRKREQLPALQQQLETIQSKIDELNGAAFAARQKLEQLTSARANLQLPTLLPTYVREQYEIDRQSVDMRHHKRISELESAIRMIEQLPGIQPTSQQARLHAEAAAPHLLVTTVSGIRNSNNQISHTDFNIPGWQAYVRGRVAELPGLRQDLERISAKRDSELRRLEESLDFYIKKL
jgi:hypothetical protein